MPLVAHPPPLIRLSPPVACAVLTQPFRPAVHYGVDYGWADEEARRDPNTRIGRPIFAAADGVVLASYVSTGSPHPPPWGYGNRIVVQHGDGRWLTTYNHLSKRLVEAADKTGKPVRVRRGQLIGLSGNTGHVLPAPTPANPSAGAHLHFELLVDGRLVDPAPFITEPLPAEQPIPEAQLEGVLAEVRADGSTHGCVALCPDPSGKGNA